MANLSEDIQCAGSDIRPPMLDKTDFVSWQQRIRLYCRGKENGVNILKSIDEGPFQMGTTRVIVAKELKVHSIWVLNDLEFIQICHRMRRIGHMGHVEMLLVGSEITKEDVSESQPVVCSGMFRARQNRGQGNKCMGGTGAAGYGGAQNRVGRMLNQVARSWWTGDNAIDEDVDEQPVQDLALNMDNVFQADDCDAYDSDVDEAPMAQTMFMANLSSPDPVCDEAVPSYDSDILSEVFGALCYPTNDSENLGKLQPRADIRIFIGYAPSRKGYKIYNKRTRQIMETIHVQFDEPTEQIAPIQSSLGPAPNLLTPGPISSGLIPNPAPAIPYVPPTNKELEMLFQPMFDEYFNPSDIRQDPIPNVGQDPVIPTGTSVSISFDLDAPLSSHISSPLDHHSSLVHHGVASKQYAEVNPFAAADPEPFVNVFAPDLTSEASSSGEIMMPEPNQSTQPHEHIRK
ncbi:retrovirus-related pol polyprotein from transposon TNT 1-94 [Tanacetum coccineum]